MANTKISALTSATTPLAGTEVLPIVQSSATVKVATNDLTVRNVRANATTGILQITGPAAGSTRVATVPDANWTAARTDAAQTFTGTQTFSSDISVNGLTVGKGTNSLATNTTLGVSALQGANSGSGANTAVGFNAGYSTTTGNNNCYYGNQAGYTRTTGSDSVFVGSVAGYSATASSSTGVGTQALRNDTGGNNVAVGFYSLINNTSGAANVGVGNQALTTNVSGAQNVAVGYQALYNSTSSNNVAIGYQAGNTITSGGNNVYIGMNAQASSATAGQEIYINSSTTGTGKGSNTGYINPNGGGVYQGNNAATWSITSDRRIKENITPLTDALGTVMRLAPVSFNYILSKKSDVSFIAQDYAEVLPDQVTQHSASPEEKELTGSDTLYGINPNLVPYLVKAIQELKAEFDAYKASHP